VPGTPPPARNPELSITTPDIGITATGAATFGIAGTASDPDGIASVAWTARAGTHAEATGDATIADSLWAATVPLLAGSNCILVTATTTAGATAWAAVTIVRH
jgi:hypothetical protein